jgi:hypothetical protein
MAIKHSEAFKAAANEMAARICLTAPGSSLPSVSTIGSTNTSVHIGGEPGQNERCATFAGRDCPEKCGPLRPRSSMRVMSSAKADRMRLAADTLQAIGKPLLKVRYRGAAVREVAEDRPGAHTADVAALTTA